jgi:hypothetical protein
MPLYARRVFEASPPTPWFVIASPLIALINEQRTPSARGSLLEQLAHPWGNKWLAAGDICLDGWFVVRRALAGRDHVRDECVFRMHVETPLDGREHGDPNIEEVLETLDALIVHLGLHPPGSLTFPSDEKSMPKMKCPPVSVMTTIVLARSCPMP